MQTGSVYEQQKARLAAFDETATEWRKKKFSPDPMLQAVLEAVNLQNKLDPPPVTKMKLR